MSADMPVEWVFPDLRSRAAGQGGDLTQFTMEGELETFVREVLQNANDAGYSETDEPVKVVFRVEDLTGDELDEFRDAIQWDDWKSQVEVAAKEDNEIASRIERFAEGVEEDGSLRVLVVEDYNTQGLTGPDEAKPGRGSTNFSALVRDSLESNKDEEAAGGKFGLGKAVLRIFSGTSMVLFNSVLSEPDPSPNSPRLIGRTKLPQHWRDETRHNGQGFFGDTTPCDGEFEPPVSLWGDDAAGSAESLRLARPDNDTPGTSIMVVGFRDPSRRNPREADELAQTIRDEAVKWFWPAIWRGDLKVETKVGSTVYEGSIDEVPRVRPFIECLEAESADQLEEDGDVVTESIGLSIPDRVEGDDLTMTDDGEVGLGVRLTTNDHMDHLNEIALVRGAGMVVRYWDRDKIVHGKRNFHAVVLGGEARAWLNDIVPTDTDSDVEAFLKDAEPPAHDDWMQTDATRDDYKQGTKKTIDELKADIETRISQLAGPNLDRGMRGPQRLGNRFPISNQGTTDEPQGLNRIDGDATLNRDNGTDRWTFSGTIEPAADEYELVSVEISLPRMSERRQMQDDLVQIDRFTNLSDGCSISYEDGGNVAVINARNGADEIQFKGQSAEDNLGVKTRINVDGTVRLAESGGGGDDE